MIQNADFRRIFRTIEPEAQHGATFCIAGGAAVDYKLAGDIDLFVLDVQHRTELATRVCSLLDGDFTQEIELLYGGSDRALVGTCRMPNLTKAIHVITTTHLTPEELVESFDISTHMIARTPDGKIVSCAKATTPSEEIRIRRWSTPQATMVRAQRLARRYRQVIDPDDFRRVANLALAESCGKRFTPDGEEIIHGED